MDGSNFYHGLKSNIGKTKIDFGKLSTLLVEDRQYIRTYYYNVPIDQTSDPQRYEDQRFFFGSRKSTLCYSEIG